MGQGGNKGKSFKPKNSVAKFLGHNASCLCAILQLSFTLQDTFRAKTEFGPGKLIIGAYICFGLFDLPSLSGFICAYLSLPGECSFEISIFDDSRVNQLSKNTLGIHPRFLSGAIWGK